jgi:hypothetical protein
MIKEKSLFFSLFIFFWIILWGSINTAPYEIVNLGKNFSQSINSLRILLALVSTLLITCYFLFVFFFKNIKIEKINYFFLLFFFSQIIGLYLNKEKHFDIQSLYLVILSIGTIFLFILCNYFRINNIIKKFILIGVLFLCTVLILSISIKLNDLKDLNFYEAFNNNNLNPMGQANPRITGLSRTLAIINLFIIVFFFNLKKSYFKKILKVFFVLSSTLIIFMQSRGSIICYFFSLGFIIFYLINSNRNFKIKYFFLFILLPFILYFVFNNNLNNKFINENKIESNRILSTSSSGRYEIFIHTLKNYDYNKFFGYGPNGDRFFLKDFDKKNKYGDNTSNTLLYSLVSGGYPSIFFLILIYFEIIKIFIVCKEKILIYKSIYINFSFACLIFFSIRSFFENSFGLFSIDFLIAYMSIAYIISKNKIR